MTHRIWACDSNDHLNSLISFLLLHWLMLEYCCVIQIFRNICKMQIDIAKAQLDFTKKSLCAAPFKYSYIQILHKMSVSPFKFSQIITNKFSPRPLFSVGYCALPLPPPTRAITSLSNRSLSSYTYDATKVISLGGCHGS